MFQMSHLCKHEAKRFALCYMCKHAVSLCPLPFCIGSRRNINFDEKGRAEENLYYLKLEREIMLKMRKKLGDEKNILEPKLECKLEAKLKQNALEIERLERLRREQKK